MTPEEILNKYKITPNTTHHNYKYLYTSMLKGLKEYAIYMAKIAMRDQRHSDAQVSQESDDPHRDIMNNNVPLPKELI